MIGFKRVSFKYVMFIFFMSIGFILLINSDLKNNPELPVEDIFESRARSTNGEFYTIINSDLDIASDLINTSEGVTFMGDDFVTALRARMAAYRGQYAIADGYAESLLADYSIATKDQYTSMYDDIDFT